MMARVRREVRWFWRRGLKYPVTVAFVISTMTLVQALADAQPVA